MNVDPLIKGIYYMYLVAPSISHTIRNKDVSDCVQDVMKIYQVSLYSPVIEVKHILVKELLRRYGN